MFFFWGIAYFVSDALLVASLIALLCRTDRSLPAGLEYYFPFKGRWLWYFLVFLNSVCLLNLGWLFWMFAREIR